MFFEKGALKNFANFTGNTCVGVSTEYLRYISILLFKSYTPVTFRTFIPIIAGATLGDAENLRKDLKEGLVMEFFLLKIKK